MPISLAGQNLSVNILESISLLSISLQNFPN